SPRASASGSPMERAQLRWRRRDELPLSSPAGGRGQRGGARGGGRTRRVDAGEPLRQEGQLALAIAELLGRSGRGAHVVPVGAGRAVALADVMQLLLERKPPGILHMTAIDHVA